MQKDLPPRNQTGNEEHRQEELIWPSQISLSVITVLLGHLLLSTYGYN